MDGRGGGSGHVSPGLPFPNGVPVVWSEGDGGLGTLCWAIDRPVVGSELQSQIAGECRWGVVGLPVVEGVGGPVAVFSGSQSRENLSWELEVPKVGVVRAS